MNKILYIILNGKEYGGSEKHVVDLINNRSEKYEVSLIMSKGNKMLDYINKSVCSKIYEVDRNSPFVFLHVKRIIKKEKPTIIHAHAARGIVIARIVAKNGIVNNKYRLVCTAHGWVLDYLRFKRIKEWLFLYNRKYDYVTLAVSKHSMNEMIKKGYDKNKMSYIYNGIDVKKYNSQARLKNEVRHINYIGRFTDQKGIVYLMDAIKFFKDYPVCFNIYGKGEKEQYIKQYIIKNDIKNVNVKGFLLANEVVNVLKDTDVLLLPSIDEGFPYILVEAVASGVPCIATNVGGVSEIINDRNGILIEPKNVDELIDAIKIMLNTNLIEKSKRCIEDSKKFAIENMIVNIEKYYE